jgi:DNA-binding response OmpR family regulator
MNQRAQVLVVDDEAGPRESLKIILKPEFEVTATAQGSQALELLRQGSFEVVLLDLTMPDDLSGTETLRAIREADVDVEAIVITGQGTIDTAVECLRLGARDYIAKPYRAEDVRCAVRKALAVRSARRRASSMREALLGNLSHEIRTPLNAIVGYSEILHEEAKSTLTPDQRQALARIQLNSERLLSYLDGLFFLAELDAGDFPNLCRAIVLHPWLERLLQPIRREAEQSGVTFDLQCDPTLAWHTYPEILSRLVSALSYASADQPEGATIGVIAQSDGEVLTISIEPRGPSALHPGQYSRVPLEEVGLGDPLAREVVSRAADMLGATVYAETTDTHLFRITIVLPRAILSQRPNLPRADEISAPPR